MSDTSGMKSSWPELVGERAEVAKQKIMSDRPDVQVFVVPVSSFVTTDINPKRVRVFIDSARKVAKVPNIG